MSQVVNIKLSRYEQQPWGFRLHGGTDFGTPLLIQKVNISSLSEAAGLQAGDILLKVNGEDVENLRHKEVQERIIRAGNTFQLTVSRGGVLSQALKPATPKPVPQHTLPRPNPEGSEWKTTLDADAAGAADNAEDFTKQFMAQLKGDIPPVLPPTVKPVQQNGFQSDSTDSTPVQNRGVPVQQYTPVQTNGKPATNSGSRTQTPVQKGKYLMSQQYNSPQSLYSEENIQEVLSQQAEVLANGVKGEDDMTDGNAGNKTLAASETLRMVQELDISGPEPEPGVDIEPSQAPSHYKGLSNKNVQSTTFKMLQRALEKGDVDSVDFVGKVHAPKLDRSEGGGSSPRMCPSPSSTLNRRIESPVGYRQNVSSPAPARQVTGAGQAQTQANLNVAAKEDIVTASNKPKKVGNSFQWPPVNQDQGPTACPIYIDPRSRTNSPAPRTHRTPTPTQGTVPINRPAAAPAAAHHSVAAPTAAAGMNHPTAPAPASYHAVTAPTAATGINHPTAAAPASYNAVPAPMAAAGFNLPSAAAQNFNNSAAAPALNNHPTAAYNMDNTAQNRNSNYYSNNTNNSYSSNTSNNFSGNSNYNSSQMSNGGVYTVPIQQTGQPAQFVQHQTQQQHQQSWNSILNANPVAAADNAADFTRNFLSQNFSSGMPGGMPAPTAAPAASAPQRQPESAAVPAAGPGQNVSAPKRGRGVLTQQKPGMRVPMCGACDGQIRGPFITAMGKTWCPTHFLCSMENCRKSLQETGFVEEKGLLYCEDCYAKYLAPDCEKCRKKIIGNCLKAMAKTFHPECFNCAYCGKLFSNSPFYLEDGLPYCEEDWNELFTTKCVSCGFPIEAGDRWVEALNNNYHSQCFNCTLCKKNLEGQSFFVKAGKAFCKSHARM